MRALVWKQIAVALAIGFLLGGGFHMWQSEQQKSWWRGSTQEKKEKMLHRFEAKLKLTDDQKNKVNQILESSLDQMDALRKEMRPKFQSIRAEMKEEIKAILTPEQQQPFEAMEADWQKARQKRWNSSSY